MNNDRNAIKSDLVLITIIFMVLTAALAFGASEIEPTMETRQAYKLIDNINPAPELCNAVLADIRRDTFKKAKMEDEFNPKMGGYVNDMTFGEYSVLRQLIVWENDLYAQRCLK